jgi:Carboxypeptidase controlling helical cell shape catalytic
MKRLNGLIIIFLLCSLPLLAEFYFMGTDHQLEIIRLKGEKPGLTVLIFGGIHGDEPGGFFSSEKLKRVKMLKGNLIVVPRVNFPSIMLNRREVHGDMNRKFVHEEKPGDPDLVVIRILKNLMKEADVFINQHDAFGFHRETYINKKYNQSRYGQSLIVDAPTFYSKKLGKEVPLAQIGKRILDRVNKKIKNPDHHFGFWDHNSVSLSTKFPEMRRSATFFALTTFSIPSFGLETSKDLPTLYHKVKYQLLAIQEILHEFQMEAIFPTSRIIPPQLHWVEFLKNGKDIIRINENTNLRLKPGDKIIIKKIFANYDSGLSANIQGWGKINDIDNEHTFEANKIIKVKKNHMTIGRVYLKGFHANSIREIQVDVNGTTQSIPNFGKIQISGKQYFNISKTQPDFPHIRFDVRGYQYAPGKKDDSGANIFIKDLIPKYSFKKKGKIYFVKIYNNKRFAGGFQAEVIN